MKNEEAIKYLHIGKSMLDNGTLRIKVANALDIKRIIVMDDNVIHTIQINQKVIG